jgi:hypothetical protein
LLALLFPSACTVSLDHSMHLDNSNVLLYRTLSVVAVDSITGDDAPVVAISLAYPRSAVGRISAETTCGRDLASCPPNSHDDDDDDDDIVNLLHLDTLLTSTLQVLIPKTTPLI